MILVKTRARRKLSNLQQPSSKLLKLKEMNPDSQALLTLSFKENKPF